ncbi:MAG: carboxypeptidase-like regulatory domain-containing protein [Flavobacteriales bacterium]|nr:carboxypeptidase-like regulatory domain-containing protein [Flavobacteriales bacterium]
MMLLFKKTTLLLLGCLFLLSLGVNAQKTIVKGKVTDATSGEALPFVNLVFKNSKVGTSTDIDGNYSIETYYPTDSLQASFIGYKVKTMRVRRDKAQVVNFIMTSGDVQLAAVEITYKGNPAHDILDRVYNNKEANNREKYDYFNYEVYNKVEFDLNNITERFKNKKMFRKFQFIFDYVDTTAEKEYLPMFMTESLSDYYYRRSPKSEKEYIKASQVSGTSNESITQFLGDMYQNVNIYESYISVFGKSFVSPIANFGKTYYRYYLVDSLVLDGKYCYQIDFVPRQEQEPVFTGTMWINDTTYAVKKVVAKINKNANINFINGFAVEQVYTMVDNQYWMLEKDNLVIDFQLGEKVMGLYGRKSTSYKNFEVNVPKDDDIYAGIDNVTVLKEAGKRDQSFWEEARHDTLTVNQLGIYQMVDSVKKVPAFRTLLDIVQLVFTGYHEIGKVEIGPYFKTYSYNAVEGNRFRIGGRTSNNFSTDLMLNGYLAYGTLDKRLKYGAGFLYKLVDNPRQWISFNYKRDLEQLGQSQNAFAEDNILSSFLRRNPNNKLTDVESFVGSYKREWITGFSNELFFKHRAMRPLGQLNYRRFDPNPEIGIVDDKVINTSEVSLYTRFAYKEKYIEGEFKRISLGSKYPILELQLGFGIKDLLDGDYNYQRFEIAVSDKVKIGVLGYSDFRVTAGKYFGTLPYTLLEIHNGNATYFYDKRAFNLMNFFEFISDEYATAMLTHHFDGFFLNKMPLMRKLKWREVISMRTVVGSLSDRHRAEIIVPDNTYELDVPYMEIGIGIENIFKIIRIDGLKRLNYLNHPKVSEYGIRGTLELSF